jgi:hypothetical protein
MGEFMILIKMNTVARVVSGTALIDLGILMEDLEFCDELERAVKTLNMCDAYDHMIQFIEGRY